MTEQFTFYSNKLKISFIHVSHKCLYKLLNSLPPLILGELVNNRSDFSPNLADFNYDRYQKIQYSPILQFVNAITILSGKIFEDNGNGFSILRSFSMQLWLLLGVIFMVIAICSRILHKENSKWTLYLLSVVGHFAKLWAVFINQSNQFGNICCVKHLILNSATVISIFVMTLFFSSEILSKLLFHPLVKIDTLDDLVEYINENEHVKLISDNKSTSCQIMRDWPDERARFIFPKMVTVPGPKFDYNQVYHGESILIFFDAQFKRIFSLNTELSFHMSSDRLFSKQHGFLYSKHIDIKTKRSIDTIINSLPENGIFDFVEDKKYSKRLEIIEEDPPQTISLSYFKRVVIIYAYNFIVLLFSLVIEIIIFIIKLKTDWFTWGICERFI